MLKFLSAPVFALATTFALPASAATIDVNSQHPSIFGDENNQNRWYEISAMQVGDQVFDRIAAGAFRLTSDAGDGSFAKFLAFCLEPLQPLMMPRTFGFGSQFAADVTADLQALAANAFSQVTDSSTAAAFQMAAWEITTETGAYDIDAGFFQITGTGAGSNASELLAQTWLDEIASGGWQADVNGFTIIHNDEVQDLLTDVAAVPVPAAGLLMLGGLAGLGLARRRKG